MNECHTSRCRPRCKRRSSVGLSRSAVLILLVLCNHSPNAFLPICVMINYSPGEIVHLYHSLEFLFFFNSLIRTLFSTARSPVPFQFTIILKGTTSTLHLLSNIRQTIPFATVESALAVFTQNKHWCIIEALCRWVRCSQYTSEVYTASVRGTDQ